MSNEPAQQFDPVKYKETTKEQWQAAAEPWHRWGPTLEEWLAQATEVMLDMADVGPGAVAQLSQRGQRVPHDRGIPQDLRQHVAIHVLARVAGVGGADDLRPLASPLDAQQKNV